MKTWHLISWLFVLALPCLSPAQSLPVKGQRFRMPSDGLYLPATVVLRINPAYRADCHPDTLTIPGLETRMALLKSVSFQQTFPGSHPPGTAVSPEGLPLMDLSLLYTLRYTGPVSVEEAVNLLLSHEAVVYAEPWYVQETFLQPNDTYADTTGGLDFMWHLDQMQVRQAWDLNLGADSVVVGIVDSGVELNHPDLQQNLALNTDDLPDGLDNDQDGYVDNYRGWDFGGSVYGGPGDNNPSIGNVHGLWVTGIVGATPNNGLGVPGLAYNCRYLPLKAAPDDSIGYIVSGYPAIVYAADQGAQVINCSWGSSVKSRFGEDVIYYATVNKRAAVVAACGNSTSDQVYYPAGYDRVISVANTTYGDVICCNSTYNYTVDLSAPGWQIWSTFAAQDYWAWGGTSAAAPNVAAAVALTKAHFPDLTGFQAGQRVRVTADDHYAVNAPYLDKLGTGRANYYQALTAPLRPSVRILAWESVTAAGDAVGDDAFFRAGDTVNLTFDLINYLHPALDLQIEASLAPGQDAFAEMISAAADLGGRAMMERFELPAPLRLVVKSGVPADFPIDIRITYTDTATGYRDFSYITLIVNRSWINIRAPHLATSINSQGNIGFNDYATQQQGLGLVRASQPNALFEGGLLIGRSATQVSDRVRNNTGRDNDFFPLSLAAYVAGDRADVEVATSFRDNASGSPLGIRADHHAYAFTDTAWDDFVILQYHLHNENPGSVANLYAGLFADWDIYPRYLSTSVYYQTQNAADYRAGDKLVYAWDKSGGDPYYYGICLLTPQGFTTRAVDLGTAVSFSTSAKFQALSQVPSPATGAVGLIGSGTDVGQYIGAGPFPIPGLGVDTVAFAILAATSLDQLAADAAAARLAYRCRIEEKGPRYVFFASDTSVSPGSTLQFSDINPGATQWNWTFGDGSGSLQQAPQHSFAQPGTYQVQLTVSDGVCTRTFSRTVFVSGNVSSDPRQGVGVEVFPNPARESVTISWGGFPFEAVLYDLVGRVVDTVAAGQGSVTLDLHGLARGTYVLRATRGQEVWSELLLVE
ncbi:MAG: S8 family serine peptidase [Bacteroidia bacterium]|nr:S8 family serine peptidase [Bacteroidia bacterium]